MPERLRDSRIIVTGGGAGIGAEFVRAFAQEGAIVGVLDRNLEAAEAVAEAVRETGGHARAYSCDVSSRESVTIAFENFTGDNGRLDTVFNNAGISFAAPFLSTTEEDFQRLFDVNVLGVAFGMQAAAQIFIRQGSAGKIVNTCSISSRRAKANFSAYSVSKFSVLALVQSGAHSLAEYGITVNGFAPGIVDTSIWDQNSDPRGRREIMADYVKAIPLGRISTPADVSPTGVFLASADSDYMTGQVVMIDGGQHMV